jgi:hypothetical protein
MPPCCLLLTSHISAVLLRVAVLAMMQHVIDRLDSRTNYRKLPRLFRLVRPHRESTAFFPLCCLPFALSVCASWL